ncbi:hypothetical protein ACFLRM_06710 [Acidobacteriota bacterium]
MSDYQQEFYNEYDGYIDEIWVEDKYIDEAEEDILALYDSDRSSVYYARQLQVKLEKKYFHWITYKTLKYLGDLGKLEKKIRKQTEGTEIHFYIHPSNRYPIRKINEMEKIVREYSQPHIAKSCGQRAEDLFCLGLFKAGFNYSEKKVKKFRRKEWKRTGHDLDFLFERDNIYYGCEIKNSLSYIDKDEFDIKLAMCDFFEIRPLFIMRMAPKSYIDEIHKKGGYALIFEWQLYELSQKNLVDRIRQYLDLKVDCPTAIYDSTIAKFESWHKKRVNANLK